MGWFGGSLKKEDADEAPKKADDSLSSFMSSIPPQQQNTSIPAPLEQWLSLEKAWMYFHQSSEQTQQWLLIGACLASFGVGVATGRARLFSNWHRITNLQDLPSSAIGPGTPYFRGRAVSVSDGDTFRFYHVPTIWFHSSHLDRNHTKKISDVTWPVRICTIDAPETAKFGKEGQSFGNEAKQRLQQLVENRIVHIQILTRDQYGRAVAQVRVGWWLWPKLVDQILLQEGLAEVYRGSGAVYGDKGLDYYNSLEEKAKSKKRGIWSLGEKRESAADYKARHKE